MKMNFAKIGFAILLGTATLVSSCNKYEEGPSFSLLSAKMRITGDWTSTEIIEGENAEMTISINNDGTYSKETTYTLFGLSTSSTEVGTWDFNSDKTSVFMMEDGESNADEATILKLENDEMKLRFSNLYGYPNGTYDATFTKKTML